MNPKLATAVVVGGLLAIGVGVALTSKDAEVSTADAGTPTKTVNPDPFDTPAIDPTTKNQTPTPVASLPVSKQMEVHAVVDGVSLVPVLYQPDAGITKLDAFPCSWRPKGVKPSDCLRKTPLDKTGKTNVDPGDENTMPPGEGVGPGCVPRPCRIFAGQKVP